MAETVEATLGRGQVDQKQGRRIADPNLIAQEDHSGGFMPDDTLDNGLASAFTPAANPLPIAMSQPKTKSQKTVGVNPVDRNKTRIENQY